MIKVKTSTLLNKCSKWYFIQEDNEEDTVSPGVIMHNKLHTEVYQRVRHLTSNVSLAE